MLMMTAENKARLAAVIAAWISASAALSGCAGRKGADDAASSAPSSLVYSPGDRIDAEREAAAARPAPGPGLRTGVRCRVHLRRDAAGLAGAGPVSIVGASRLSEQSSVAGTIERVEAEGISVRADGSTYWIPRGVILAVEFPNEPRP